MMPASRRAILRAMPSANPTPLGPVLGIEVKGPTELIGAVTGVISGKRGKLVNIEQKEVLTVVEGELPAAETFDLSEVMRGATAGKAVWNTHFKLWQAVPTNMLWPRPYCCSATTGIFPKRDDLAGSVSTSSTSAAGLARATRAVQ